MTKAANFEGVAYPMDLQLFSEEPAANPEAGIADPEPTEEPTEPTETIEEPTQEPSEPQEDITQTQAFARRLKEETAKAEQRALDNFIEQTYGQTHGIRTMAEYQQALEAQRQQEISIHAPT